LTKASHLVVARAGEGVVHRDPLARVLVLLEHREVDDPEEVPRAALGAGLGHDAHVAGDLLAQFAQALVATPYVSATKSTVSPGWRPRAPRSVRPSRGSRNLAMPVSKAPWALTLTTAHAARAEALDELGVAVGDLAGELLRAAGHADGLHDALLAVELRAVRALRERVLEEATSVLAAMSEMSVISRP
jgi:hypothetical protein